ncbi:MAG TPA: hypothetical protein VGD97_10215 [Lacunisphaera sp.]
MEQLDVRKPMGLLFLSLGLILAGYGLLADPAIYARHSLGQNVNLTWGIVFVLFGAAMLWLARRARRDQDHPPSP